MSALSTDSSLSPVPHSNLEAIRGLEPAAVFEHFVRLTDFAVKIGGEEPVRQMMREWAEIEKFTHRTDQSGNLAIYVPGRGSGVGQKPKALQFHLDMVLNPKDRNYTANPIPLYRDTAVVDGQEEIILSSRDTTTIGADNRLGAALAMAAATDRELTDCPPLILLATWGEEEGLKGAIALDPSLLNDADMLFNLDNEDLGVILNGCAGQATYEVTHSVVRTDRRSDDVPVILSLQKYPGGHSGMEIHQKRGNAIRDLTGALSEYLASHPGHKIEVASITGGTARNALAEDSSILIWAPLDEAKALAAHFSDDSMKERFRENVDAKIREEKKREPVLEARIETDRHIFSHFQDPMAPDSSAKVLELLLAIPHGVALWDGDAQNQRPALSNNLGLISTSGDQLKITCMARHIDFKIAQDYLERELREVAKSTKAHLNTVCTGTSTGWIGNGEAENPAIRAMAAAFRENSIEPTVTSIHAGIECGEFNKKVPHLAQAAAGPSIRGGHTTGELIITRTVEPMRRVLNSTLRQLATLA
jgi:dipeptidase D